MLLNNIFLTITFVLCTFFSSLAFGKSFQIKTRYNIKSVPSTIASGITIYFLFFFALLLPTLFIDMPEKVLQYYFITCLIIVFTSAIILFFRIRKTFTKTFIQWVMVLGLFVVGSILLILPNINSDNSFQLNVLVNDAFDKPVFDPFIERGEGFLSAWVRLLSGWLTLFESTNEQGVFLLTKIGVPIIFSLYFVSIVFLIGSSILKWSEKINRILSPLLFLILISVVSITNLDITLGFMMPLVVLLTGLVLYFFRMNNPSRGKGISILIALVFNLSFLFDFNTWAIGIVLAVSLIVYQGFRFRAISLSDGLMWMVACGINIVFIYSDKIEAVIAITILLGLICAVTIRYLTKNKYTGRFKLENRFWRYLLLLFFLAFVGMTIGTLTFSGSSDAFYDWLEPSFWGNEYEFTSTWVTGISVSLILVVVGLMGYSGYFFIRKLERSRNHLMIIIATTIILFFNPLVSPLYAIAGTENAYFYGFIYLFVILLIGLLNFLKEIKSFKETRFLSIAPILLSIAIGLVSYATYLSSLLHFNVKDHKIKRNLWSLHTRRKKSCYLLYE